MKLIRNIWIAAAAICVASPAWAGFVENRSQWDALGASKAIYLMGLFDARAQVVAEDEVGQIIMDAREQCLIDNGITGDDLVKLVDEAYAADASIWTHPPVGVLLRQTTKVCRTQLNAALIEAGHPAQF